MRILRSPTLALFSLLALSACVGEIAGGEEPPETSAAPLAGPNDTTVTFNSITSSGTRVRDHGGIRWNDTSGGWSTWFDDSRPRPDGMTVFINNPWVNEATATFDLPAGKVLKSLRVVSPDAPAKVKISSAGNPDRVWTDIGPDYRTLTLAWSQAATRVSVTVTSAGLFGVAGPAFDDIVYGPAVGGPPQVFEDPSDGIEWEPIDLATTRQLRDSFSWNNTTALSEAPVRNVTVDGQVLRLPAIHYALIYVRDANELRELDEIGVHYDLAPLFGEEWPDTGTSLVLPFNGDPEDGHGMFAFALLPAITYNALRAESLAGEDTFRAVILRDVPESADAGNNTVSYDFIAENMASWAPPRTELTDEGEVALPPLEEEGASVAGAAEDKRLGRFLRRALRRVRDFTRGSIDLLRRGIGALATLVVQTSQLDLVTSVNDRTRAPLVRGWDDGVDNPSPDEPRGFGKRLTLNGLRVNVSGMSRLTLYQAKLNNRGRARVEVPRWLNVQICFEADSPTAKFERGLLRPVLHCWPIMRPTSDVHEIRRAVGDTEFYVMAQLIDARDYAKQVLGFTPPKATIQSGDPAQLLTAGDAANAFVPCLEATNAPASVVDAYNWILQAIPGAGVSIEFLFATDMVLNAYTRHSRLVPVHEYGHFVFCTLLDDVGTNAFDLVWSQVLDPRNFGNDSSTAVKALNEGFADWFASQVVGGTDYFVTTNATLEREEGEYFYNTGGPSNGGGMEANVGGPPCGPLPCFDAGGWKATDRVVGTVATLLHDAIDQDDCAGDPVCRDEGRSDSAVWDTSAMTGPFTPVKPFKLDHAADEAIQIAPAEVIDAIRLFAERRETLTYDNFYSALRDTLEDHEDGYSPEEICKLFALHNFEGNCDSWPDGSSVRHNVDFRAELVPPEPGLMTPFGTVTANAPGATCTPDMAPTRCRVTEGAPITLTANPTPGFLFTVWTGACHFAGATTPTIAFPPIIAPQECVANFRRASFLVTGNASGSGFVNPPVARVPFNTSVTLQATPSTGHRFVNWTGDPGCAGNNPTLTFVPMRDVVCVANFLPITFTVTGTVVGAGTVSPTTRTVNQGGSATLTATPNAGSRFVNWTGSAQCTGTSTSLTISPVNSNVSCTANFAASSFTVTATATAGGSVSPTSRIVTAGGSVTLTATPSAGNRFVNWTGSAQCTGTSTTLTISPVNSNVSCTANFGPSSFTVRASATTGGSVSPTSVTVAFNGSTTLRATASSGNRFVNWTGSAQCTGTSTTLTISPVTSNVTCTANFTVNNVTVSFAASPSSGGTVTATDAPFLSCWGPSCTFAPGSSVTLTAQPSSGYVFAGWTGCATQSEPVLRRTNVTSNESCTATFIRFYRVTYSAESPATARADVRFGSACSGGVCNVFDGGGINLDMEVPYTHTSDGWTCTEAGTGQVVRSGISISLFALLGIHNDWTCRGEVSLILN